VKASRPFYCLNHIHAAVAMFSSTRLTTIA
jgi:hypothetical protein